MPISIPVVALILAAGNARWPFFVLVALLVFLATLGTLLLAHGVLDMVREARRSSSGHRP